MFDQKEFNEFVLDNHILNFYEKPIKLKSGDISYYYFNWRKISKNVSLLEKLVDYVIEFTRDKQLEPDCFVGVPEGATKLGLFTQYKWCKGNRIENCILPMIRKEPKNHGVYEDKYFIGAPKGKTIILEDVITTGSSVLEILKRFDWHTEIEIIAIYSLTDRMNQNDRLKFIQSLNGIKYYSLSNASDLLKMAYDDSLSKNY